MFEALGPLFVAIGSRPPKKGCSNYDGLMWLSLPEDCPLETKRDKIEFSRRRQVDREPLFIARISRLLFVSNQ
jgi:hypothetical protein